VIQREPDQAALAARLQDMVVRAQMRMEQPSAPDAPDATVTDLKLTSTGSQLFVEMQPHAMTEGTRLAVISLYRAEGAQEWSEAAGESDFRAWTGAGYRAGSPYSIPMYVSGCRVDGEHRIDVYVDGRRVASRTVPQQGATMRLTQHYDVPSGLLVCRPESWTLDDGTSGSADLVSPDGRYHLSLRMLPLDAPPTDATGRIELTGQVLDRLTRQLTPAAQEPTKPESWWIGRVLGTGNPVSVSDLEAGYVWAGITDDGTLCAMTAHYPKGDPGYVEPLLRYALFQ
jgi:hypothetical protein